MAEPDIIASGDWWTLDAGGTLSIFCVGPMPSPPWEWGDYISVITSVVIADSVTSISAYAFDGLSALESLTIPDSVTEIEEYAVSHCPNLTDIAIPNSVTSIGYQAFTGCTALTSVTIPGSVRYADALLFEGCTSLTSAVFGDGFEAIPYAIFDGCFALERVTIPDSVTFISAVFMGFYNLSDVYYSGTEEQWNSISIMDGNDDLWTATIHYNYSPYGPEILYIGGTLSENGKIRGASFALPLDEASAVSYEQALSLDGNELQSDEIYITVRVTKNYDTLIKRLSGVSKNTPVWFDRTDSDGYRRLEKYYWKSVERTGKYFFEITAQSPIGRLTTDFPGGLYQAEPLPDVLRAVLGGIVPATIDNRLGAVRVYGWIPYGSRREAIHSLTLACGFVIRRDSNRDLYFTLPSTVAAPLPDTVIFHGGAVSYRVGQTYYQIDVTKYAFLQTESDAVVTLFDNTADDNTADNLTVKFADAPVYDLAATEGLTIIESGVNHAVVSGVGVLTAKRYTIVSDIFSLPADTRADPDAVLSISDVTVITDANAESVAEKLRNSFNAPAVVGMDFIRHAENPGDFLSFADPYGENRTGYLISMSGDISSIDRVTAQFLCGYTPVWGNTYTDVLPLYGAGSWTVPDFLDGQTVRVVLISGGSGGASGQHGSDDSATGGGRGLPGDGGKVLSVKITVAAGQTYYYQCGAGGAGGSPSDDTSTDPPPNMTVYVTQTGDRYHLKPHGDGENYTPSTLRDAVRRGLTPCQTCFNPDAPYYLSNPGEPGDDTVFGDYSSGDGKPSDLGFFDIILGHRYALPGPDNGVDGGPATSGTENGDRNNPAWRNVERFAVSLPWDSSQSWISGAVGASAHEIDSGFYDWAYGGLGGGAAVGSAGQDGADANQAAHFRYIGGNGGDGASASAIFPGSTRSYGSGGSGGHGGGEGGKGGTGHNSEDGGYFEDGADGSGGSGSAGQDGADGCVLIYFKKPETYLYRFDIGANGHLRLTYYTPAPPQFSRENDRLIYTVPDGESPPDFSVENRHLYLRE